MMPPSPYSTKGRAPAAISLEKQFSLSPGFFFHYLCGAWSDRLSGPGVNRGQGPRPGVNVFQSPLADMLSLCTSLLPTSRLPEVQS